MTESSVPFSEIDLVRHEDQRQTKSQQAAFYDVGLITSAAFWSDSDSSQRVGYEDFRLAPQEYFDPDIYLSSLSDPLLSTADGPCLLTQDTELQEFLDCPVIPGIPEPLVLPGPPPYIVFSRHLHSSAVPNMDAIQRYSGGGGSAQRTFMQDCRTALAELLRDWKEQQLDGFGQWEFLQLLGRVLSGEARDVHLAFMEEWDPVAENNPNRENALILEHDRQLWRLYRREKSAFFSLRKNSGIQSEPQAPQVAEPEDLNEFFDHLQARFKLSTTENLSAMQTFRPQPGETPERMFARFNILAKSLEEENPPSMTVDQIKTTFIFHLHTLLSAAESADLAREIREEERYRLERQKRPLTRHHIHEMVLRQNRESVIADAKLRAAGLLPRIPIKDRLGERLDVRINKPSTQPGYTPNPRVCHRCGQPGHVKAQCRDGRGPEYKNPQNDNKRSFSDSPNPNLPIARARTAATDGATNQAARQSNGGRGSGGNKRAHLTPGTICSHCGVKNHTADQCWRLHPDQKPPPRHVQANYAATERRGRQADREWEAQQLARQRRSEQYEEERTLRAAAHLADEKEEHQHQYLAMQADDAEAIRLAANNHPHPPELVVDARMRMIQEWDRSFHEAAAIREAQRQESLAWHASRVAEATRDHQEWMDLIAMIPKFDNKGNHIPRPDPTTLPRVAIPMPNGRLQPEKEEEEVEAEEEMEEAPKTTPETFSPLSWIPEPVQPTSPTLSDSPATTFQLTTHAIVCPALSGPDPRRSARVQAQVGEKRVHFHEHPGLTRMGPCVARGAICDPTPRYGSMRSVGIQSRGATETRKSGRPPVGRPLVQPPPPAEIRRHPARRGKNKNRRPLQGGEMHFDMDLDHIPRSFPAKDLGALTPGTTNLEQPPEGSHMSPPPSPPVIPDRDAPVSQPGCVPLGGQSSMPPISTLIRINDLCEQVRGVQITALSLKRQVWNEANKRGEIKYPAQRVNQSDRTERNYRLAQLNSKQRFAMATLPTTDGELEIDGHVPAVVVIDTGAGAVILGKEFASTIPNCNHPFLEPGDTFITASGVEETGLGRTKYLLTFIIGKGTLQETKVQASAIIADTNAYDVILGMDFLGACFGMMDPLTEEFIWRIDCNITHKMPSVLGRLPAHCRGTTRGPRHSFMIGEIMAGVELDDALMWDEEDGDKVINMANIAASPARMLTEPVDPILTSTPSSLRRHEALARLEAALQRDIPVHNPRTRWVGGPNQGAVPVVTNVQSLDRASITKGLHVLDLFAGITCSGLRTVLEAGYRVECYTSVEIDDISRAIARNVLSALQSEFPGQLPDRAINGYNKRLPQNIAFISEIDMHDLVSIKGPIHFICGGWECQSMSLAGQHLGIDDERFMHFLDMICILNYLQKEQHPTPLYLFENTYPGKPGQYPRVDDAAKMIESFIGMPVVVDAAGVGSAAHRVRHFWTNWCKPEVLQSAFPKDILPNPPLETILHADHRTTLPAHHPTYPFVPHNKVGHPRVCMPTIVSYPGSHAYRPRANNKPGEGQLWNKRLRKWEEPFLEEKELLMGYNVDSTMGGLATRAERSSRLGQAMDGNTIRWFGAFLYAANNLPPEKETPSTGISVGGGFTYHQPWDKPIIPSKPVPIYDKEEEIQHQACSIVEKLVTAERDIGSTMGGGSEGKAKRQKFEQSVNQANVLETEQVSGNDATKVLLNAPSDGSHNPIKPKWKVGGGLTERDQLDVLRVLSENNDRFAYQIDSLERYTGPPMEIHLNTDKDIFRPPHKLGEKEWTFVGEQCEKLEKLGFIRRSSQSKYASATVVVRKKDEDGNYTDFRKCGDYRPLNLETDLDRYQLPLIESIFNDMKGAKLFSKLDLRSGYHQMSVLEADRSKTAFWGAQRILWEWCVVPFGLKNAPPYFQRQMDKVLAGLPFARCYIDDIVIWSKDVKEHLEHISAVFARLRDAGLKVHPGKCQFAVDKIDFLGHTLSAKGLSPQEEKVSAVRELPPPTDISSLRSALGLFSYYRKFVRGFSVIAAPLHSLLRKGVSWSWGSEQEHAYADLKDKLCTAGVLRRPDSSLPYVLTTDWSQRGMGAVLSQIDKDGVEHPVSYASRSCNPAEKNYGSCEGECLAVVWATQHFREYIFGSPFTLVTDHEPLKWLMQTNKTTGKLARWSLLLQEYDLQVVHKRGVLNTNADCLSRFPTTATGQEPILPDWGKGDYNHFPATAFAFMAREAGDNEDQREGTQLEIWEDQPVLHFLRTHLYLPELCALDKDRVYRRSKGFRWLAHNLYKLQQGGLKMQLVPRPAERTDLTIRIHRDMGHYGIHRVLDRMRLNYWWKGMDDTVLQVVKACVPCARTKAGFRLSGKELKPLALQGIMFRWGIDFAGPLPVTEQGNKYVLVCIEHCTKWVELIALPSKSSAHVARAFLENVLSRYGAPGVVLTDQGSEFKGEFQTLLNDQQITHRVISREHPQADGLAERMVQTLKQSLRRCLMDRTWQKEWDEILPYVAMGYRISKQKSVGFSPYFLLYGRQPLFPSKIQHLEEEEINPAEGSAAKLHLQLAHRGAVLQDVMPMAMKNLAIAQQRDIQRYRHVRGGQYDRPKALFAVGDFVMLKQKKVETLDSPVRPHILRVAELRNYGVVILQGSDGATISHQVNQIAPCSVPVADTRIYPELLVRTQAVHCEECGSRDDENIMLLCDLCNKGFHTCCLPTPLKEIPFGKWRCHNHGV